MTPHSGNEMRWRVHGLNLTGLTWGKPGARPVLCLHGWLDNAASFALLAPHFTDHYLVAPDLTGHGQSDRRSADATYQIWDDLPEVLGIVETLGWNEFDIIGHSRGAVIGSLFAASFPERIRHLVMLDAVGPQPVVEEKFPEQMRSFLEDKGRLLSRDNRVFSTVDEAALMREEGGLSEAAARLIAERNLVACHGGFTWTTDPRLRGASAVKLTPGQVKAVLNGLTMPTLLLLAKEGHGGRFKAMESLATRSIPNLEVEYISGGHQFHMEPGVEKVAERLMEFFQA